MDNVLTILGRRLDVAEPLPPDPEGAGSGDGDATGVHPGPPDDLPMLVSI